METSSKYVLINEADLYLGQCLCCGEIELQFKGLAMALTMTDLYGLIDRLDRLPLSALYLVGLLDVRETTVRVGFQSIGLQLTGAERERLLIALHYACMQLDSDLLSPRQLPLN